MKFPGLSHLIAAILIVLSSLPLSAARSSAGLTETPLIKLRPDPYLNSLGNASTADTDYPFSYWKNPAAYISNQGPLFSLNYIKWLSDVQLSAFSFLLPVKKMNFGLSAVYYNSGVIETRENLYSDSIELRKSDFLIKLNTSRSIKKISTGLAADILFNTFTESTGPAFLLDAGAIIRFTDRLHGGLDISHIGLGRIAPLEISTGIKYRIEKGASVIKLFTALSYILDEPFKLSGALEYIYDRKFHLTASYDQQLADFSVPLSRNFALGTGVSIKRFRLMMAFLPFYNGLKHSFQVSVGMRPAETDKNTSKKKRKSSTKRRSSHRRPSSGRSGNYPGGIR